MSTPAVNITLRLTDSKIADDAKKAESTLRSALNPTVDVFHVAEVAAHALEKAISAAFSAISHVAEQTGGFQSFERAIDQAGKALFGAADRSGALRSAFSETEKVVKKFTDYLNSKEGREAVNDFFSAFVSGAASAIDAVNGMYRAAVDAIENLKKSSIGNAFRKGLVGRGLSDGFSESLAEPTDEEKYGKASVAAADLSDHLHNSAKKGVEKTGTFVDPKAVAAAESFEDAVRHALEHGEQAQQKIFMDSLKVREDAATGEMKSAQGLTDFLMTNEERRQEIREKGLRAEQAAYNKAHKLGEFETDGVKKQRAQQFTEYQTLFDGLSTIGAAGASAMATGIQAAFSGADFGKAFANAFGPGIAAYGASLFLMGTGALAENAIASFFPELALAFGIVPGLGVPAAIGAIAAGTLLMGGAAAISALANGGGSRASAGGAGGGAGSSSGGGGRAAGGRPANTPQGFQAGSQTAQQPLTVNNHYSFSGPMGGSPRRIARDLRDRLNNGRTLETSRPRLPGGRNG